MGNENFNSYIKGVGQSKNDSYVCCNVQLTRLNTGGGEIPYQRAGPSLSRFPPLFSLINGKMGRRYSFENNLQLMKLNNVGEWEAELSA